MDYPAFIMEKIRRVTVEGEIKEMGRREGTGVLKVERRCRILGRGLSFINQTGGTFVSEL